MTVWILVLEDDGECFIFASQQREDMEQQLITEVSAARERSTYGAEGWDAPPYEMASDDLIAELSEYHGVGAVLEEREV